MQLQLKSFCSILKDITHIKMENLFIPILLATGREGRQSEKAAKFMFGEVEKYGLATELLDIRAFNFTRTDNVVDSEQEKNFSQVMKKADGLIIVSPEYNHGYPGELKIMLDQLYEEYNRKPIGICGVSAGGLGGARMVEQLRLVAIELQMVPIREAVYFSNIGDLFDAQGNIKDSSYVGRIKNFLDELVWYAKALKNVRSGL